MMNKYMMKFQRLQVSILKLPLAFAVKFMAIVKLWTIDVLVIIGAFKTLW